MPEMLPSATGQIWMNCEEICGWEPVGDASEVRMSSSEKIENRSSPRTFERSAPGTEVRA